MEEADQAFFERVIRGFDAIAGAEPSRVKVLDGTRSVEEIAALVWKHVGPVLEGRTPR
jgi:dTMP kinase